MAIGNELTAQDKVKIRHHLGFLNVQEAQTFVLGTPAGVETQFAIEGAMNRLLPEAVPHVRELIERCNETECQRFQSQDARVEVKQVGDIQIAGKDGVDTNVRDYNYWRQALANAFGIYANPFDKRDDLTGGGPNVPVLG